LQLAGPYSYQQQADPARLQELGSPPQGSCVEIGHASGVLGWEGWRLLLLLLLLLEASKKLFHHTTDASTPSRRPGDAFCFFKASKPIKTSQNI
jgi:hypothetical protein